MQRHQRYAPLLPGCLTFCALVVAASVRAQTGCTVPHVDWDDGLPIRWQRSLLAACDALAAGPGLEPDIEVRAARRGHVLLLRVKAADGRRAVRRVGRPDEVLVTMQALVLVPPTVVQASGQAKLPEAAPKDAGYAPAVGAGPERAYRQRHLQVEIGAVLMGRLAFAPEYASPALALHAGLHLERYTLGLDVRWNPYQTSITRPHPVGLEVESLGAGLFVTRRVIDVDAIGVDLGARAFLAADTRAQELNEAATESTVLDGRIGMLARWSFGAPTARWALELDAELSPARLREHGDFPAFSVGLGGGGVWEVK